MMTAVPKTLLAPSLLASDHANLAEGIRRIEAHGLEWAHIDIMDGHFVPNLTFGPGVVAALRERTGLFFDVHLMLDNPDKFVDAFAKAGANLISVHIEPDYDVAATLREIRHLGCRNGLVLNPDTPVDAVLPHLEEIDLVLAMTVQPGFGGQEFRGDVLPKLEWLAAERKDRGLAFRIEVDGGVNLETAPRCRESGADTLVAGTAFFKAADKQAFIDAILGGNA